MTINWNAIVKTYDVRGLVGSDLTPEIVSALAAGFVDELGAAGQDVVVGHDMRDSSPEFADAFAEGAQARGANVVSIRPVVVPVRALRVGDVVDVWTTPSALIASQATVLAVSADEQGYSAATKTIDLGVKADQVQALLAAQLADQSRLAVVRSPLASESDG